MAVTAEANDNVDSVTAQALKTKLTNLDLTLTLASATVAATAVSIERIGGTDAPVASTQPVSKYNFALGGMTTDNLIPAGQTYYYKITATVGGLDGTTVGSLQAKILAPDAGDFVYDDNDSAATYAAIGTLRLGVSTITALKINQN